MFSLLTKLSSDLSVEVAYYAARLLRYKNVLRELTRAQVLSKGLHPPSPEILQAVNQLIKEIESAEGASIEDLPDSTIENYRMEISNIVLDRSAKEVGYSAEEGQRLLRQLRETERRI